MGVQIDEDIIVLTEEGDEIDEILSITALTWTDGGIKADDVCDLQTMGGISIFKVTADKNNGLYSLNISLPLRVEGVKVVRLDSGNITIYRR